MRCVEVGIIEIVDVGENRFMAVKVTAEEGHAS
jgi:hypothetical protein